VVLSELLGSDVLLHLDAPASSALTADMLDADELVDEGCRFIARVPPSFRPAPGARVRLRVDLERVHLFDPATEAVIAR
jgi:multiple sugar transport system ATP-binding protein